MQNREAEALNVNYFELLFFIEVKDYLRIICYNKAVGTDKVPIPKGRSQKKRPIRAQI